MKNLVDSQASLLESLGIDQKQHISEQESEFNSLMEEQEKKVVAEVAESQMSTSSAKTEVGNFSRNVILIDEDVEQLADRVVHSYDERLTATPSVETILHPQSIFWSMVDSVAHDMNEAESMQVVEPVTVG